MVKLHSCFSMKRDGSPRYILVKNMFLLLFHYQWIHHNLIYYYRLIDTSLIESLYDGGWPSPTNRMWPWHDRCQFGDHKETGKTCVFLSSLSLRSLHVVGDLICFLKHLIILILTSKGIFFFWGTTAGIERQVQQMVLILCVSTRAQHGELYRKQRDP